MTNNDKTLLHRGLALARRVLRYIEKRCVNHQLLRNDLEAERSDHFWEDVRDILAAPHANNLLIIDAGANQGNFSAPCIQQLRPGTMHLFEPDQTLCVQLRERFAQAKNLTVHGMGLGAICESKTFHVYANRELNSVHELSQDRSNPFRNEPVLSTAPVRIITLDSFAQMSKITQIHLLKIDTQGFDFQVLQGAADLLRRKAVNLILIEINFQPLYQGQDSAGAIIDWLSSCGYSLFDLYDVCRWPSDDGTQLEISWCNALFVPRAAHTARCSEATIAKT